MTDRAGVGVLRTCRFSYGRSGVKAFQRGCSFVVAWRWFLLALHCGKGLSDGA